MEELSPKYPASAKPCSVFKVLITADRIICNIDLHLDVFSHGMVTYLAKNFTSHLYAGCGFVTRAFPSPDKNLALNR